MRVGHEVRSAHLGTICSVRVVWLAALLVVGAGCGGSSNATSDVATSAVLPAATGAAAPQTIESTASGATTPDTTSSGTTAPAETESPVTAGSSFTILPEFGPDITVAVVDTVAECANFTFAMCPTAVPIDSGTADNRPYYVQGILDAIRKNDNQPFDKAGISPILGVGNFSYSLRYHPDDPNTSLDDECKVTIDFVEVPVVRTDLPGFHNSVRAMGCEWTEIIDQTTAYMAQVMWEDGQYTFYVTERAANNVLGSAPKPSLPALLAAVAQWTISIGPEAGANAPAAGDGTPPATAPPVDPGYYVLCPEVPDFNPAGDDAVNVKSHAADCDYVGQLIRDLGAQRDWRNDDHSSDVIDGVSCVVVEESVDDRHAPWWGCEGGGYDISFDIRAT